MMKYEFQNVMTKMGVERRTELEMFRSKISECMDMVSSMAPHDRITVSRIFYQKHLNYYLVGSGDME